MSRDPEPAAGAEETILARSAQRLVVRRDDAAAGGPIVVKRFLLGSLADAEVEARAGAAIAGPGVVESLGAGRDPASGKPTVATRFAPGLDLRALVDARGALPLTVAASIGARLATTLARLAATRDGGAAAGWVHRDVKPGNVLLASTGSGATDPDAIVRDALDDDVDVLLLDFEHVCAAGADLHGGRPGGFTGGTHGYAPPEAYAGAVPTAAFDVFGLGCVLHELLCGRPPIPGATPAAIASAGRTGRRRSHRPPAAALPASLRTLVDRCLATVPTERPDPAELARRLEAEATRWRGDPRDAVRLALLAGDPQRASTLLADAPRGGGEDSSEWTASLEAATSRAARLLPRLTVLPETPPAADDDDPATTLLRARFVDACGRAVLARLARFPNDDALRARARDVVATQNIVLERFAADTATLRRTARHSEALELVDLATRGHALAARLATPSVRRREAATTALDPEQLLRRVAADVEQAARRYEQLLGRFRQHQADLELDRADEVLTELSSIHGGASEVVARQKDRQLRLSFYLSRIARLAPVVGELADQAATANVTTELEPLEQFLEKCRSASATFDDDAATTSAVADNATIGMLRHSLDDLVREYPRLAPIAAAARTSLDAVLEALTRSAWSLVEDATAKLTTPPIPIRPLQSTLHRLDALRVAEALIDLPERPRAGLFDRLETVRLELDRARATRDSIARGAQAAMDRGHLTTALFDIARAVDQYEDDSSDDETSLLARQFEEAKRRKQAIETATAECQRLAVEWADLVDRDERDDNVRIATLERREDALLRLVAHLPGTRASEHRHDLRDVQLELARELSRRGTRQFEQAETTAARVTVANETWTAIHHRAETGLGDAEQLELGDLLETWTRLRDQAETALNRDAPKPTTNTAGPGRRSRAAWIPWTVAAAALVAALGAALWSKPWEAHAATADSELAAAIRADLEPLARSWLPAARDEAARPPAGSEAAVLEVLGSTAQRLSTASRGEPPVVSPELAIRAADLVDAIDRLVGATSAPADAAGWLAGFERGLELFDASIDADLQPELVAEAVRFGRLAHAVGWLHVRDDLPADRAARHDERTSRLRVGLRDAN